ncbi:hypothetical protein GUJ93_ZPchr0008g11693 [Zizania palustris]|uniref:Uncharacterized protein n=1 Tax=Zizania palustris TaxID=103762 RepID=A0A8J5VKG4_ZIZPA|nr:hypothetical protein GUJ93_ZPchr0008g11693 [Zizania palustris]
MAAQKSELGLRRCGARTSAAQGPDLGSVGLRTRQTAFLGDSVQRMAAQGSADGGAEVGARPTAVWGSDLGGARPRPRRRRARNSVDGVPR